MTSLRVKGKGELAVVAEVRTVVGWRTRLLEAEEGLGQLGKRWRRSGGVAAVVQEEFDKLRKREAQCALHGRAVQQQEKTAERAVRSYLRRLRGG